MTRKSLVPLLYLYAALFSIAKTLRFPNDWAEAHWMIDYRFGFIKRGLAGELFGRLFHKSEYSITLLSAGILFLLYLSLFVIAVRETRRQGYALPAVSFFLLFFVSQYLIFSAHLIGYLDSVIFLMTIGSVYLIRWHKILLSSLVAAAGIFIHEISFFLMLPACCLALVTTGTGSRVLSLQEIFSAKIITRLALFLASPVLAIVLVSSFQEHQGQDFQVIYNYLRGLPSVSDRAADSVASAYTRSFSYYLKDQSGHFFQRLFRSRATVLYGLPMLFMLGLMYRIFSLKRNIPLLGLMAAVAFVPLLLHAVAYDTYRIWTFPYMILFLEFWILNARCRNGYAKEKHLHPAEKIFCMACLAMAGLVADPLFDGETERFSFMVKILLMLPVAVMLHFIQKAPAGKAQD